MSYYKGWSNRETWEAYRFLDSDPELLELAAKMGAEEIILRSDYWLTGNVEDIDFDEIDDVIRFDSIIALRGRKNESS